MQTKYTPDLILDDRAGRCICSSFSGGRARGPGVGEEHPPGTTCSAAAAAPSGPRGPTPAPRRGPAGLPAPRMAGVADEGAERHVLGIDQLHGHVLVQDVAEALEEAVHRPDPVALESAPGLAYLAVFVGRVGHFRQELVTARSHLAPEGEAWGQELASQSVANCPVFGNLLAVRVPEPVVARRHHAC